MTEPTPTDPCFEDQNWSTLTNGAVPFGGDINATVVVYDESAYVKLLNDIDYYLWMYTAPFLIACGTIGSVLAILVLQTRKFRGTATSFTLCSLAIVDCLVLYTELLRMWILYLTNHDVDLRTFSISVCKFHIFISYFFTQLASWILVQVTIQRAIFVFLAARANTICTKRRSVKAWCLITIILFAVNLHFFWTHAVIIPFDKNTHKYQSTTGYNSKIPREVCFYKDGLRGLSQDIAGWTNLVVMSVVPFILIGVLNTAVIVYLLKKEHQMQRDHPYAVNHRRWNSVSKMLFVASFVFLLTTLPSALYFVGNWDWFPSPLTPEEDAEMRVTHTVLTVLLYVNNAIHFLLYVISGRSFRRALITLLCGPQPPTHPSKGQLSKRRNAIPHVTGIPVNLADDEQACACAQRGSIVNVSLDGTSVATMDSVEDHPTNNAVEQYIQQTENIAIPCHNKEVYIDVAGPFVEKTSGCSGNGTNSTDHIIVAKRPSDFHMNGQNHYKEAKLHLNSSTETLNNSTETILTEEAEGSIKSCKDITVAVGANFTTSL